MRLNRFSILSIICLVIIVPIVFSANQTIYTIPKCVGSFSIKDLSTNTAPHLIKNCQTMPSPLNPGIIMCPCSPGENPIVLEYNENMSLSGYRYIVEYNLTEQPFNNRIYEINNIVLIPPKKSFIWPTFNGDAAALYFVVFILLALAIATIVVILKNVVKKVDKDDSHMENEVKTIQQNKKVEDDDLNEILRKYT